MKKKEKAQKPLYKKWWFWVIVVSIVGAVGSGLSGNGEPSEPTSSQQETQLQTSVPEPTGTLGANPAETMPEPAQPDSVSEPITPNDWEIITRVGHPALYGSVEDAHAIWEDVEKKKIIFPDGYDKWSDNTILSLEAYRNSDLIRGVYISFSNFVPPAEITLEDIIPVVASYMPYEIMDEYYEFRRSYSIAPDEDKENTENYYVISYGLTDTGKQGYGKDHEYSGSIDVIICTTENGNVENFNICFGTPRWMSSLETNSMHQVPWDCDLNDYR